PLAALQILTSSSTSPLNFAPGSVGIAASPANHRLRPPVDEDGLRELAASHLVIVVDGPRLDIAIMAIGTAPIGAVAALERRHLCVIGAPAVLVVHRLADTVANEAADKCAADDSGGIAAAHCPPEQRARRGAKQRSLFFLGSACGHENRKRKRQKE